jgi:GNAT superfamily N-acetyltransferase
MMLVMQGRAERHYNCDNILPPKPMEPEPICPVCGLCYAYDFPPDVRYHKRFHDVHVSGPKIKLPNGIHVVYPRSPMSQRRVAGEAARLFRREMKYDICSYYAESSDDFRKYNTTAWLFVSEGRAVGVLIGRDYECTLQFRLDNRALSKEMPETLCRSLEIAWVLASHRNRGIGKQLLTAFLGKLESKPLAVQWPLSPDGERLLRSLGLTEFWIK